MKTTRLPSGNLRINHTVTARQDEAFSDALLRGMAAVLAEIPGSHQPWQLLTRRESDRGGEKRRSSRRLNLTLTAIPIREA